MEERLIVDDESALALKVVLEGFLTDNVVSVTFVKRDGSLRTLRVTTDPNRLPLNEHRAENSQRVTKNEFLVTVFDIDANLWKSFDARSVRDWTLLLADTNDPQFTSTLPDTFTRV